ncbi:peptidase inhibitor family I36 protein [Microbacterium resistens]|uniref:peptidase inhibitor family I36 protein n=1 Tax=Microbacterium resistens TaxID=156977 RepID=UPI0036715A0B
MPIAISLRRRRRPVLLAALAALALICGGAVATTSPADATTRAKCPDKYLCLYYNTGWSGARADLFFSDAKLSNERFNDGPAGVRGWKQKVGNNSASVWNRTGATVRLYDFQGCTSTPRNPVLSMVPGAKVNLGEIGWRNRVSSVFIDDGRGRCVPYDQSHL